MRSTWIGLARLAALTAALASATPALAQSGPGATDSTTNVYDPWEGLNRALYHLDDGFSKRFNIGIDTLIVRPAALTYQAVLPKLVRKGVRNLLDNIDEPNTAMNDVLQGRLDRGGSTAARFVINSTVGVLGLFDVAGKAGLEKHYADFGQTLGRWGLPPGPYIYIPVLGPSDLRDGTGRIVDSFTGLLNIRALHITPDQRLGVAVIDGLDTRAGLDSTLEDVNRTATDPYATQRSAYMQHRRSMLVDTAQAIDQLPTFDAPPPVDAPSPPAKP